MDTKLVFYPLLMQILLTLCVWGWMYFTRIRHIVQNKIAAQDLADAAQAHVLLKPVAGPSENLVNLFEIPVLFYVAAVLIYVVDIMSPLLLLLLWVFVVLRYVHSYIHCTYNRVTHRFAVYFMSTLVLWGVWVLIAQRLFF